MLGTLTTNIEAVQARLRLLDAELQKAVLRALDIGFWRRTLASAAEAVLKTEAAEAAKGDPGLTRFYDSLIPQMVKTVMGDLYEGGAWFTMTVPHWFMDQASVVPNIATAAAFNQTLFTPSGRPTKESQLGEFELQHNAEFANLEQVRQVILDWCTYEKDLDPERDFEKGAPVSPQELADRIMSILGVGHYAEPVSAKRDAATEKLVGAIQAWLDGASVTPSGHGIKTPANIGDAQRAGEARQYGEAPPVLASDMAHDWLAKVLAAWVQTVRDVLPGRLDAEMAKVRETLSSQQQQLPL